MARKKEAMYEFFGKIDNVCANCCHLLGDTGCYRKCEVYGVSHSEATDWALSWQACGLFNQPVPTRDLYKELKPERKPPQQIAG